MMRTLPELKPGQDWCCGGCGSGIVKAPKKIAFEYSREEFPDGRVISMAMPQYVASCCGGELLLWDEGKQDCIPWAYAEAASNENSQRGSEAAAKPLMHCAASRDGECGHALCPQLRDNEPAATGRHCPLDNDNED